MRPRERPRKRSNELKQSLLMAGMDHNLTSTPVGAGQVGVSRGGFPGGRARSSWRRPIRARCLADEDYTQYEVMAEAFRWAMITHLVMGKQEFFPAVGAGRGVGSSLATFRVLEAAVLLSAAENYAAIGDAVRRAARC